MKKTLAAVLTILMVLTATPFAMAASSYLYSAEEYTLEAEFEFIDGETGSVEQFETSVTDTDATPEVTIKAPFDNMKPSSGAGIWDDDSVNITLNLSGFTSDILAYKSDLTVKINGTDETDDVTWVGDTLQFDMGGVDSIDRRYKFAVELYYKDASDNIFRETVTVYVNFENIDKGEYSLKFPSTRTDDVVLKDGIYFIDSATSDPLALDGNIIEFVVTDGSGSKFSQTAYYGYNIGSYVTAQVANKLDKTYSSIKLNTQTAYDNPNTAHEYYVTLETETSIYKGKVKVKYRTGVELQDPKGVYFASSTYTIGINQVLTPTYKTTIPVYQTLSPSLSTTEASEKGIVDIEDGTIIGLREGTAYVRLNYQYSESVNYTDTCKVIVSGVYDYQSEGKYVVTASSLNVRSGAGTSYSKIGSLKKGALVEVLAVSNGWAKISYNSSTAYVSASYLSAYNASTVGSKTVIARVLNVRSGPGTSYSKIGSLTRNTVVEVLETVANGAWAKINYNGTTAYISTSYLVD